MQFDKEHYFKTAEDLANLVDSASDRIDEKMRLPSEIAKQMADNGFFRLLIPRSLGGAELNHPDFLKIVGIFARADGSTAWCINQNNVFATNSVRVPEDTAREIWTVRRNVVTNGQPTPESKAILDDKGYRLSGRWNFSSGIHHATWVAALTPVYRADQAELVAMHTLLLPKKDVKLLDVWQVVGLRGTGSLSFEADDVFVPFTRAYDHSAEPREAGPLYVISTTLMFASGFATVALGVARAGLDAAIDLARSKTQASQSKALRDQSTTHRMIGEAEAIWNSARAFLEESTIMMWNNACIRHSLTIEDRIRVRLASTHAIRKASEVVDIAYTLCGSSAIFQKNPINRKFHDIHAITQQIQARLTHYDSAGQFYLGQEPEGIF